MTAPVRTTLGAYKVDEARSVLGQLISAKASAGFSSQYLKQVDAWEQELILLESLSKALAARKPSSRTWTLLLEYPIPRRNKYPDAVILAEDLIFIIEFKFGALTFDAPAKWQVEDYALDLRDFHLASRNRPIIPILVATEASQAQGMLRGFTFPSLHKSVWPVSCVTPVDLAPLIDSAFCAAHQPNAAPIDPYAWDNSPYRPSLSIIEAAKELFAEHSVREITHAYADNLSTTTDALLMAISASQEKRLRTICFVTGVPGAGKTLTGLSAIHSPGDRTQGKWPGVFLSGNGPLVKIVGQALIRDAVHVRGLSKRDATRKVGTFIQNVHAFMDEYTRNSPGAWPDEHVVVFDEAQRAWNIEQVKRKSRGESSEPMMMLEIMERCPDWSVIVALVGGGQEIHNGEAGLEEWGRALSKVKTEWHILASREAFDGGASLAGHRLFDGPAPLHCHVAEKPSLHLDVNVRSLRAQMIAQWVNCLLCGDPEAARSAIASASEFPLVFTRDLDAARCWLRERSRLERRCGLVASSGSLRHRAYGIEVSAGFRRGYVFDEWFLGDPSDVRASYQLEVAASEFECQGLELDWVGLCWGDDLCISPATGLWLFRQFRGSKWQAINNEENKQYLLNKYRVLLTRAREGMAIWVPPGDPADPTRNPTFLDATAAYLAAAGVLAL